MKSVRCNYTLPGWDFIGVLGIHNKWDYNGFHISPGAFREKNKMAKFKKGDNVRIRINASNPFRGRIGIVEIEPNDNESATVVGYIVKFESKGKTSTCLFDEQVLEAISDK